MFSFAHFIVQNIWERLMKMWIYFNWKKIQRLQLYNSFESFELFFRILSDQFEFSLRGKMMEKKKIYDE